MGTINIENAIVQLQGDIIVQNQKIEQLREEIRLLRLEVQKKPVVITSNVSKIGYRTFNQERVREVMKQFKAKSKNEKSS
jgi:hypothetical protein